MSRFTRRAGLFALLASLLLSNVAQADDERDPSITLYTASNGTAGNVVLSFAQRGNGTLLAGPSYATGGRGTGAGLGNQNGLILSQDERFLLAVNAGSNDVSVFQVRERELRLVGTSPSGGVRPVSIAVDRGLVYVLNAGSDDISGFQLGESGRLYPLAGSRRTLSGTGVAAAEIAFSPDGRTLVVTERATNNILTFPVDRNGLATGKNVIASQGQTPFGFSFSKRRQLIISEAAGGAANASSASSYRLGQDGGLTVLSAVVPTLQSAACWVVVTPDGRLAFVSNTGSATISAYRVSGAGRLQLLKPDGISATTGAGPIDLALSSDGRILFSLNGAGKSVDAFRVRANGDLAALGSVAGLPAGANGLVALRQDD